MRGQQDLKKEWEEYLEQTKRHVEVVTEVFEKLGLDPKQETPGRKVVRHIGESLVKAMKMAKEGGKPEAAQLVACECVVLAETKDHSNWELMSQLAEKTKGKEAEALKAACEEVEEQEDEHLYHSKGWCRELWIQSLGMPAVHAARRRKGCEDSNRSCGRKMLESLCFESMTIV